MADAPRMVVFDWGGVVLRICRTWREGCERAGVPFRGTESSTGPDPVKLGLVRQYETGAIEHAAFVAGLAAASGDLYTHDEITAVHDAWLIGEYPGMDDLLAALVTTSDELGIRTGLLSNTNERHWRTHLSASEGGSARFSAVRRLHHRHASHLFGFAKPGRDIYQAFERATGFTGKQVLFFDDRADNIDAARSIGWRAEQIDPSGHTAAQVRRWLGVHEIVLKPS